MARRSPPRWPGCLSRTSSYRQPPGACRDPMSRTQGLCDLFAEAEIEADAGVGSPGHARVAKHALPLGVADVVRPEEDRRLRMRPYVHAEANHGISRIDRDVR